MRLPRLVRLPLFPILNALAICNKAERTLSLLIPLHYSVYQAVSHLFRGLTHSRHLLLDLTTLDHCCRRGPSSSNMVWLRHLTAIPLLKVPPPPLPPPGPADEPAC